VYPDGYRIGTFDHDGSPRVHKRPAAAYEDELFARKAREDGSRIARKAREDGSRTSSRSRPPLSVTHAIASPLGRRRSRLQ
jgi:hypothetical protein